MSQNPFESLTFGNSLSLRVDGAIGTMSLSPNGRDAVLAGRKGLFIIDLDDPFMTPRWLHHITSWEVADVQWSPHHFVKPSWCISTSNQKALLWDLARPSNNAIAHVLHRHTRAIADINFHPMDPEVLATCSIDTFVYSWDMRSPRRPIGKWAEWRAGATQVKWSHNDPHQLVSSHDHSFFLWDTRKGAVPVLRAENAHTGKINGLDFSSADNKLTTCSNDESIKVWDLLNSSTEKIKPSVIMQTEYPVARARSLPFGKDGCCGIMPLRGGGNAIHIINYQGALNENAATGETVQMDVIPDYSFRGHQGPVKDFLWRTLRSSYAGFESNQCWEKFQMVSWSSYDFDLKLWPDDSEMYNIANYNPLHQKLFNSLVRSTGGSDSEDGIAGNSPTYSPNLELSEEVSLKKSDTYRYNTYCVEPLLSMKDYYREYNGDSLSSMAYFKIMQSQENADRSTQLNHLDWISGVRMGDTRSNGPDQHGAPIFESLLGPRNLGEEVSIVGHKFPKLRFEKISVSTGHLVMTFKGPLPKIERTSPEEISAKDASDSTTTMIEDKLGQSSISKAPARNSSPLQQGSSKPAIGNKSNSSVRAAGSNLPTKESVNQPQKSILGTHDSIDELWKADQEQSLAFIRLEVKFPKSYPHIEDVALKSHKSKKPHKPKNHRLLFDIEETHEITPEIKRTLLEGLNQIAEFYTTKFARFCLEPCLRFLMGDRINLNETEFIRELELIPELSLGDNIIEVGDESWADDLVDLHNAAGSSVITTSFTYESKKGEEGKEEEDDEKDEEANEGNKEREEEDEDEEEDIDLIPMVGDHPLPQLTSRQNEEFKNPADADPFKERIKHDTTPLPKGCGAIWSHSGRLVCFFLSREHDEKAKRQSDSRIQKRRPDERYFSAARGVKTMMEEADHLSSNSMIDEDSDHGICLEEAESLSSSLSSDASFNNDWDELIENDVPSKSRVRGLFRESMRVGGDFFSNEDRKSGITRSAGGTTSNYRSSTHGDCSVKEKRTPKSSKGQYNRILIADFSHLIPEKVELALSYRVLGDTPESLARHNHEVAQFHGFFELSEAWKLIELILIKKLPQVERIGKPDVPVPSDSGIFYWGNHPYGHTWLVKSLFDYFERNNDLQMLAMMSCVLHENITNLKECNEEKMQALPLNTPYNVVPNHSDHKISRQLVASSDRESHGGTALLFQLTLSDRGLMRKPSNTNYRNDHIFQTTFSSNDVLPSRAWSTTPVTTYQSLNGIDGSPDLLYSKKLLVDSPQRQAKYSSRKAPRPLTNRGILSSPSCLQSRNGPRQPPTITISMKNFELLDVFDDLFTVSLLSEVSDRKMAYYREQYAEILYSWGLLYNRVKILKFNYTLEEKANNSSKFPHKCEYGLRFRKSLSTSQLLLTPLTSIKTARASAWNTKKRNDLQTCALCSMIVSKRALVCTNCEHILHPECALIWWLLDASNLECPTGCGCDCLDHGIQD